MPTLPSDTITLPLLPRSFARSTPKKMYQTRSVIVENVSPLRLRDDDDHNNIHNESVVEIYNNLSEWKKVLLWIAVAAAALFLISILICLCQCCCRRRRVVRATGKEIDNSDAASTISHISGPMNVAAPRGPLAGSPGDHNNIAGAADQMEDISLKTPANPGRQYAYGMFVNNQRNITGLAPPQKTATYGAPSDPWKSSNPSDRFGGPSTSYMN
ncbi:hypothetical protein M406DRAFT_328006 [Cryphonectria parasitica EP155]|uniref:Uncharacterized protein n=1 Tax=Cryphonectria parasitica (strain ATCC 38755 / EP155) TaxID=660469 RepID=A0A9P4Y570_CRYP1|nr:uncharacterized protein M406DRAFT_328006 [Cryphonectria parasitica EP155]KAF3766891.1 hypothetical protein M406DRAFT_328006 [Cryphonectria parasitica EP155]